MCALEGVCALHVAKGCTSLSLTADSVACMLRVGEGGGRRRTDIHHSLPAPPALLNSSQPRFYPSVSNQRRIRTKKLRKSPGQVKLRSSITPGTVLILLTGRHKGKVGGARGHGGGVAQG